ncbi:MBOAT family O-acyltransferase [Pedobacter sp.]|uniref:MBOAT family O-acyltransferase n=1 Tax=Pedobacter sp. TaxID=1411316 RepID=UPI003D7FAC51
MLFNSLNFAFFLPVVFFLYWFFFKRSLPLQNLLLLVASYFFYACWDWRFLFLLVFSILLDFTTGIKIAQATRPGVRKFWLWLSISINLGLLGVFKYFNFFSTSFAEGLSDIGLQVNPMTLNVILPIGISFYTFHGLSYIIDVYKNRIEPERNFVVYSVFVSFFPLLVAGPIERATHLLPQIKKKRKFSYTQAVDGLRQILWGLFKKVVIADNCAYFANMIFNNSGDYSGSTLVLGALFFTFQIYGDFSGYSDIALGTAKLFGIELLKNFNYPYFSRDIAEFWRRWHISLSSWFKDYVYIPLGGSKGGNWMKIRNTFIIFILSGFWHGANWTFIVWGFLNALFIIPSILLKTNRSNIDIVAKGKLLPSLRDLFQIILTFSLTVLAWIFFRAKDLHHAFQYIGGIFSPSLLTTPELNRAGVIILLLVFIFFIIEWLGREGHFAINHITIFPRPVSWAIYFALILLLFSFQGEEQAFIYFQF